MTTSKRQVFAAERRTLVPRSSKTVDVFVERACALKFVVWFAAHMNSSVIQLCDDRRRSVGDMRTIVRVSLHRFAVQLDIVRVAIDY